MDEQIRCDGPLTEWEETQQEFDDLWWHGNTPRKCGLWGGTGIDRFWDVDFRKGLFKAHLTWGHRWGGENSKRKTLRTHRDGSRKNYRLRTEFHEEVEQDEMAHARRRKKRFGGKEHRQRGWSYNKATKRYKSWTTITKPCLDE